VYKHFIYELMWYSLTRRWN